MYRTILVPVDGSPAANAGLAEAIRIAAAVGARLHLMNIIDDAAFGDAEEDAVIHAPEGPATGGLSRMVRERGESVLRHARAEAEAEGVIASTALVRSRSEGLQVLLARQAEECGADLIVLGTHGHRPLSRLLMNSETDHLLNVVSAPVMLVRSEGVGPDLSVVEITGSDSMFHADAWT